MEPAPGFDLKPYHLAWAGAALFGFFALLTLGNGVSTEKRNPRITLVLPAIVISTCIAGIMFLVQLVFTVIASDAFSVDALWTAFVTTLLIVTAVALPMDAFIAAVTVVGADRAIRGEQAKIGPVVSGAPSRMFALIPLIVVFYAILLLPYILIVPMSMIVMSGGAETLLILPSFALIAVEFVAGVLLGLAPIVMVIEKTGLVDTFKRTYSLTHPALGRLLGIHLLWFVVVVPISIVTMIVGMMVHWIAMVVTLAIGISFGKWAMRRKCSPNARRCASRHRRRRGRSVGHARSLSDAKKPAEFAFGGLRFRSCGGG